jgi:ribonuclease-3
MLNELSKLSNLLGHKFATPEYLRVALRHSSLAVGGPDGSNERYEFLGDRILSLVIAEMLLGRFPNEREGDIAKRHTALVRQEALVRVAETINLGDFIEMDDGTGSKGGRKNLSILADCCEAIIAALYIDGGLDAANSFITTHWIQMIDESKEPPKDAKTTLQEWAQSQGLPLPKYREDSMQGPAHKPVFVIEAMVEGKVPVKASGTSKQKAEQLAAELLLKELNGG